MFGMQQKKKRIPEWTFDLEKDLSDPAKMRSIKNDVESQVRTLKDFLRQGGDKKAFDQAQILLHGYLAAQKVISRIGR